MIIYYKQISEGFDDRKRFQIMQKVGMSRQEVRQTIRSQVVTVFFLPACSGYSAHRGGISGDETADDDDEFSGQWYFSGSHAVTIVAFAIVYLIVYTITARAYYKIVE